MSGTKKRVLIEENSTSDSKSTTIITRIHEEKHTKNTQRQWYVESIDQRNHLMTAATTTTTTTNENNNNENLPNKIERILRKINLWSTNNTNRRRESVQDISFNKTNLSTYDNLRQGQHGDGQMTKSTLLRTFRPRCCSSTYVPQKARPHSMISIESDVNTNSFTRQSRTDKVRMRIQMKSIV